MWPKSPLFKLNPVLDEDGGIRSNERLQFAEYLPYGERFPKLLLRGHWVTKHYHEHANHSAGINFLLSQISEKYWVIAAHGEIREWEGECSMCKRCFLRSFLGSPSIPLTKQQWTMLGLLPRYREEVCTIKRGGFACLYAC